VKTVFWSERWTGADFFGDSPDCPFHIFSKAVEHKTAFAALPKKAWLGAAAHIYGGRQTRSAITRCVVSTTNKVSFKYKKSAA